MKVDILVAGFQKCGTTALHNFLTSHPSVISSNPKELDYFNYDVNYKKGDDYYHSFFNSKYFSKIRGLHYLESSPSYINDKNPQETASRILQYNPEMKVIVLVRNPVERSFSAWNMYRKRFEQGDVNWWFNWVEARDGFKPIAIKRTKEEYEDFGIFIQKEIEAKRENKRIECQVLDAGLYHNGIEIFKNYFGKNLIVVKNEELNKNTEIELNKIAAFLNLKSYEWFKFNNTKIFKGNYEEKISDNIRKLLENFYLESNAKLFKLTGIKYNK